MINLSVLLILSFFCFFVSYQALRYRRTYWWAPTISGFKKRKKDMSSKEISYLVGILSFVPGIWLLILFVKGLF